MNLIKRTVLSLFAFGALAFGQTVAVPQNYFDQASVRALMVQWVKQQVADSNQRALDHFVLAAQNWEAAAKVSQSIGVALPPKPVPPFALEVVPFDNGGDPNVMAVAVSTSKVPLAPPVPDLTPLPLKPTGVVVSIGVRLYGNYFQSRPEDNAPDGWEATKDGQKFRKVMSPFGGWWLQL